MCERRVAVGIFSERGNVPVPRVSQQQQQWRSSIDTQPILEGPIAKSPHVWAEPALAQR